MEPEIMRINGNGEADVKQHSAALKRDPSGSLKKRRLAGWSCNDCGVNKPSACLAQALPAAHQHMHVVLHPSLCLLGLN